MATKRGSSRRKQSLAQILRRRPKIARVVAVLLCVVALIVLVVPWKHHEAFKNVTSGVASIATTIALGVGGYWTYRRFIRTREAEAKIDLDVELSFVRYQGGNWIVEGVAVIKNPGSVRLDFKEFGYELHYALSTDTFASGTGEQSEDIPLRSGQKGSWSEGYTYLYLEPGERSRYSFVASLPADATIVQLGCEFTDKNGDVEIVKKIYAVPKNA